MEHPAKKWLVKVEAWGNRRAPGAGRREELRAHGRRGFMGRVGQVGRVGLN